MTRTGSVLRMLLGDWRVVHGQRRHGRWRVPAAHAGDATAAGESAVCVLEPGATAVGVLEPEASAVGVLEPEEPPDDDAHGDPALDGFVAVESEAETDLALLDDEVRRCCDRPPRRR